MFGSPVAFCINVLFPAPVSPITTMKTFFSASSILTESGISFSGCMFGRTGAKIERGKGEMRYISLALIGKVKVFEEVRKSRLAGFYTFYSR
jgi:hypothetical protein